MNISTIKCNNNITKAQANIRYPRHANYTTKSKSMISYGIGIKQKPNINPSDAIEDLLDSKSFMDCERLALTVTYKNALDKLGPTVFNNRVRSIRISTTIPFTNVPMRLRPILEPIRVTINELKVGDWVYLENTPRYSELCALNGGRQGAYAGEHLIVSDTNPLRFRGHINSIDYNDGYELDFQIEFMRNGTPFNEQVPLSEIKLATDEQGLIIGRRIID